MIRLEVIVDYARVSHNDSLHRQVFVFLHKFKYVEIALSTGNIKNPPNTGTRIRNVACVRPIYIGCRQRFRIHPVQLIISMDS